MEGVHSLHHGQVHVPVDNEVGADVNPLEHQDAALQLDLALGVSPETTASGGDTARFQRTPERAGQSIGRRGDEVVEGGGVRRAGLRRHAVCSATSLCTPNAMGSGSVGNLAQRRGPFSRSMLTLDR